MIGAAFRVQSRPCRCEQHGAIESQRDGPTRDAVEIEAARRRQDQHKAANRFERNTGTRPLPRSACRLNVAQAHRVDLLPGRHGDDLTIQIGAGQQSAYQRPPPRGDSESGTKS